MSSTEWVQRAADLLEAVGVATIVIGAFVALVAAVRPRPGSFGDAYRGYRQALGKAILLGLEFLVAADIVRTVSHVPTVQQVSVLGGIVLIRTFLSFTLEVELEGRWPWQRHGAVGGIASPAPDEKPPKDKLPTREHAGDVAENPARHGEGDGK
jgi:uncharacterized membrane protein